MCIQIFNERVKVIGLGGTSSGCGGMIDITYYDFFFKLKLDSKIFKGILLETRLGIYFFLILYLSLCRSQHPHPFCFLWFHKVRGGIQEY
jgi:hypothetical protein